MTQTFGFSFKRRLDVIKIPIGMVAVLAGLLVWHGRTGTWKFWALTAIIALLVMRVVSYLRGGRNAVTVDDQGVTRSGRTVAFAGAELELRTLPSRSALALNEVVLWTPRDAQDHRTGVGFDHSLTDFDRAARLVFGQVPEARVVVTAPGEQDIQGERREEVLHPLRPTAADRALAELGRSPLSVPPHLRN